MTMPEHFAELADETAAWAEEVLQLAAEAWLAGLVLPDCSHVLPPVGATAQCMS